MARPKPSAQGELLTHRDEFHNHNHCIKYHRLITIVLQCRQLKKRSTITSGNYGYGGGDGYWICGGGRWLFLLFLCGFPAWPSISRHGEAFYIWVPSRKLFRLTIRWQRQLYGRTKMVPPYSCPLRPYSSSFGPRFLGVLWNLVSSTLML